MLGCLDAFVSIWIYAPEAKVPLVKLTVTGIETPLPLSNGKLYVPVEETDICRVFPFKSMEVPGFRVNWLMVTSSASFMSALADDVTLFSGTLLEILNTVPTGVDAFPNWKVPPTVVLVPVPPIRPRSRAFVAVLSF